MRKIVDLASIVAVLAVIFLSPASAGWACKATGANGGSGVTWSVPTEAEARTAAMEYCAAGGDRECKIYQCRPNVDTQEQAEAIWPRPQHITNCNEAKGC